MSREQGNRQFAGDSRAVSAVIGFILIFGILMLLLTVYQAQIVPQQNAQTEFTHFEEVSDEMIEIRSAVSSAGQSDRPQFPTIQLGTTYQTRLLTINPPPPSGTLQTSEPYDIKIDGEPSVPTRFLEYQPGYNELTTGSVWYENSVVYHDDQDERVLIQNQNIVTGDERLRITALQNELDETGTNRLTVELYPTETNNIDFEELEEEGAVNITLPTRLDDHWNETLIEDFDDNEFSINKDGPYPNGVFALNITVDVEDIHINTVGIRSEPNQDTARNIDQDRVAGDSDDDAPELDDENTITFEDDDAEFNVIERTENQDVLFEGTGSEFLVKAGDDNPANMEGIVRFDEDDGTATVESSDDEVATSQEIFMRGDSELNILGNDDERVLIEDDVRLGSDSELTAESSDITGGVTMGDRALATAEGTQIDEDVVVGLDSSLDVRATDEDPSEISGDIEAGDSSNIILEASDDEIVSSQKIAIGDDSELKILGNDDERVNVNDDIRLGSNSRLTVENSDITGEVTMEDSASATAEGTQIDEDVVVGSDSSIDVRATDEDPSEISGDVEVGDDTDITLEASDEEEAIIDGSLTYEGDGTVELIDSSDENSQINGQVIIEDEDSTVKFILKDEDRFDDLDVVDGDGNELDEDDDQVELTT